MWWNPPTTHTPDGVGFWVVSRHADALTVAGDPTVYSSERAPGAAGGGTVLADLPYGFAAGVLLNMMDDPRPHRNGAWGGKPTASAAGGRAPLGAQPRP